MSESEEQRLRSELETIDRIIRDYRKQREKIAHDLRRIQVWSLVEKDDVKVTKKNKDEVFALAYIKKILKEQEEIGKGSNGLNTKQLYNYLSSFNTDLKYSTFRSYLHRFKEREIIQKQMGSDNWMLVLKQNEEANMTE